MAIVLFTDFGSSDLYVGQVKAVLAQHAPGTSVIDLLHDVPSFGIKAGAHLLDALKNFIPVGSVVLAVVDPGVGSTRAALVLEADGRHYVGPDNGLLSVVGARAVERRWWRIVWRPGDLSASFHGRDLFAPVAALLAMGRLLPGQREGIDAPAIDLGSDDAAEIIYIDHYGNACTGLRPEGAPRDAVLLAGRHRLRQARVFAEVPQGTAFWYVNSQSLVEIAVNLGSAAQMLDLSVGNAVSWGA